MTTRQQAWLAAHADHPHAHLAAALLVQMERLLHQCEETREVLYRA